MPTINELDGGGGTKVFDLGTGQSFNVTNIYPKYKELTIDNFMITSASSCSSGWRSDANGPGAIRGGGSSSLSRSYNPNTGIANIYLYNSSNGRAEVGGSDSGSATGNVHAYLVVGKIK